MNLNLPSTPIDRYTVIVYRVILSNVIPHLSVNRYIYYRDTPWNDHPWSYNFSGNGAAFTDNWAVEIKWDIDDPEFCEEGRVSGWARLARFLESDTSTFATRGEAEQFMIYELETRIQRRREEIEELRTKLHEIQGSAIR